METMSPPNHWPEVTEFYHWIFHEGSNSQLLIAMRAASGHFGGCFLREENGFVSNMVCPGDGSLAIGVEAMMHIDCIISYLPSYPCFLKCCLVLMCYIVQHTLPWFSTG